MADEIVLYSGITATPTGVNQKSVQPSTLSIDMAGTRIIQNVQDIGATTTQLEVGDLGSAGMAWFANANTTATNYIDIGRMSGTNHVTFVRCYGGGVPNGPFRLASLDLTGITNSGTQGLDYFITEA